MVLISSVDVRAVIQKELRGSHIAGEMQRSATIAAFCVDQHRIRTEQVGQAVGETKSSSGMHAKLSAALH